MDERLSRSNRLPGSEKLTRPEEIGQLSKYLKSIKEVYEESTRLEDQVLGVSGYSTGKIPEVGELEKKLVKAPTNEGENPDLSQKILGVPGKRKEDKLEKKRIDLEDNRENRLEKDAVKAPKNHGGEVLQLEEVIKKIQDVRNQNLEGKRLNLLDERQIALEDTRLDLQAMINASLRDKRIDLSDNRDIKLEDTKLNLTDSRQPELEDKRLNLKDERESRLSDKIIGLKEPEEIGLEDKRLDIKDEGVNSLETKRINLSAEENIELGNKRLEIYDSRQIELEDKKIGLKDDRKVELGNKKIELKDDKTPELENTRLNLTDDRNTKLGDTRVDLFDDRNPELPDKKIGLVDDGEVELGNKRLDIWDEREQSLSDKRLDLEDDRETELGNKRIGLEDSRETELGNKRLDLTDERENELEDKKIELEDNRKTSLSDKVLGLKDDRETSLSDKILGLTDDRESELEDKRLDLNDERETSLSDKILELTDERNPELSDKIIGLEDNREIGLGNTRLDLKDDREDKLEDKLVEGLENENGEPEELYDSLLELPENENGEPGELYSQFLGIEENQNTTPDSLSEKILNIAENQNTTPDLSNVDSLKEYTAGLSDAELYEFAMKIANEGEMDGWLSKVESLMSAYLSSDILTPKRAIEFRDAINNTLEMSYFGSQTALRVPVDTSSGTTWAKAEEAIGEQITGTNRRDALDEMIVKMVDYKKISLPGSNIIDTVKDNIPKNASDVISGSISHNYPVNAPIGLNGLAVPGGPGDAIYQAANNRTRMDSLDHVGDVIGNTFYSRYWSSKSFKTTLEDLCPIAGKAPVASLAELKAILKSSPYFTSPGKFMTDTKGSYNTMTLDTNMYWEVTIEPFCCDSGSCSNGGYSYLPDIREINYLNKEIHKVRTNYGRWAPINSFELQKSKLQTKSLQLFEGEIAYPSGMEFTNELRLTFVDDSWKSWKRYFERCAQASVFNTNEKKKDDYESEFNDSYITRIDKTNVCVASYKNVTFNIKIYILNPQLNLLNRFNLLCVLKDFSEEYVGDIDSGGTDLNVSFSIVGENPEEDSSKKFNLDKEVIASLGLQAALETQKRVTAAINSSVGLL